jgi:hypothetical protein
MPPGWRCRPRPETFFPFFISHNIGTPYGGICTIDRYHKTPMDLYGLHIYAYTTTSYHLMNMFFNPIRGTPDPRGVPKGGSLSCRTLPTRRLGRENDPFRPRPGPTPRGNPLLRDGCDGPKLL